MVALELVELAIQSSSASPLRFIVSQLALSIVVLIANAIRNRYYHPLHRFPGPFWGSITDFYKTYLFSTQIYHEKVYSLHEKYGKFLQLIRKTQRLSGLPDQGPILRIAPNLLSFSEPSLLPQVYHRAAEKTPFYSTGLAGEIAPLLQIQSHGQHAMKKKVLAPTVSFEKL